MNKFIQAAAWVLASLIAIPVAAQSEADSVSVLNLGLEEALDKAQQSGYEMLIARQERRAAKAGFNQTNAVFLPQISLEESAVKTNDPIGVFGIKLRQGIITQADFNPDLLNDPDATHNFTTRVELRQPVLNPEGFFQRSAAKYQYKSATEQLNATSEYLKLKVKELYYQLNIADQQIEVLEKHLNTSESFEQLATDYYDQGIISKAEYLDARVNVLDARKEKLKAENRRASLNDQLLLVLGIGQDLKIQATDELNETRTQNFATLSPEGTNSALKAMENQVNATGQMLKAAKSSFLPSLNLFGSYEMHDSDMFGNQADNYMIGASLKWDLFKGFKQAGKVSQRKAELRKTELRYEQSKHEHQLKIREAKRSVKEALDNIELASLSIEQSEEDVRIRNDRYEQGLEKTSDLLLAETKNLKNKLSRLQAVFQYHISIANLEYLLETEL